VFRGPISFRNALAQSINIPAVKALYLVGVKDAIDFAESLGVKTLEDKARYGLTLVLGGGEVTLLDMTSAYGVFANNGKRNPYEGILRVESAEGEVLREFTSAEIPVVSPDVAHMISDVLSDNVARTPAFGSDSYLYFSDRAVAVKTGTTNDYRDAWIIGYTPDIVVGAWAGNNNNSPMEKKVAGFIVAPLWNAFMRGAFPKIPDTPFPRAQSVGYDVKPALRGVWEGSQTYIIDRMSGKLATEFTPDEYKEERVIASPHEILHFVNKDDPRGPAPTNPDDDPQYQLWEVPTQNWLSTHGFPSSTRISNVIPLDQDNIHTINNAPIVVFQNPTSTAPVIMRSGDSFLLSLTSIFPVVRVDYTIDGTFIDSIKNYPYSLTFDPESIVLDPGAHSITATAFDSVGNRGVATVSFVSE
jgi:membrane peptidoglycan carboxypeptidase